MCPRVDFGAETCKVGSRKWNERFNVNHVPLLRVPAPISLMQFDCVALRSEGQPHPFTIGGQQNRLNAPENMGKYLATTREWSSAKRRSQALPRVGVTSKWDGRLVTRV